MKNIALIGIVFSILTSCSSENKEVSTTETTPIVEKKTVAMSELDRKLKPNVSRFFKVLPSEAPNPENEVTEDKVALGKKLYYDKKLSKDETQSCNTCHNLETFGVDNLPFSPGDAGKLGGRNSPTTLNAALHKTQFWDGRAKDVEEQAGGPILNPIEMNIPSEEFLIERLSAIKEYQAMFIKVFPYDENPLSYKNIQSAIGAFERTLLTPSKFDDYLGGDYAALNDVEKEGLDLFMETGCTTCHSGALLGGTMFQKFGTFDDYWKHTNSKVIDKGRFEVTKKEGDMYMFKVPSLRNVAKTSPYFHDGSVSDLKESVRIMAKIQLDKELDDAQLDKIVAFLNTLTGEVPASAKL